MHKTIYIEADEEITSIIDRIKKEGSPDVFIVVPPNAMLIQGVINLKLLKKESAKINKNIILVTNDKQAKKVIGRIGFETKEALSPKEMEKEVEEISQGEVLDDIEQASLESIEEIDVQEKKNAREIGSPSFFAESESDIFFNDIEDDFDIEKDLSISPGKVVKRMDMIKNHEPVDLRQKGDSLSNTRKMKKNGGIFSRKKDEVQEIFEDDIDFEGEEFHEGGFSDEKAEEFFAQKNDKDGFLKKSFKKKNKPNEKSFNKKVNYFFITGMIVVLSIIGFGGWTYFNWPQVNIIIYPNEKNISSTVEIEVLSDLIESDIENGRLTGKMEEIEFEKTLEFEATGEKYSSDQGKARGKVTIYNKYSSADQPLVATTRVLSEEGKLFRLVNSVTVPGMEDEEPGKIEVKVISDQPGSEFNIKASTFTIEGFKGGPKYDKFEVKSDKEMTGGSDVSDNNLVKYVTETDIEKARSETLNSLDESFDDKMKEFLSDSRGYVLDSAKKEVIENISSHDAGDVINKFSYTIKQKVKLMTFSTSDLIAVSKKAIKEELDFGYELDENEITTEIIKDITDFEKKTVSLKVNVFGIAWPKINHENFKKGIADQKEDEFQNILNNYQEIKKVDISYNPGWLSGVAVSEDKINILEKKELISNNY